MTDMHDIVTAARPPLTAKEAWQKRQRRTFIVVMAVGLTLFVIGLGWMTRPDHDSTPGIWAVILGFVAILVAAWFGMRAVLGEPPEG